MPFFASASCCSSASASCAAPRRIRRSNVDSTSPPCTPLLVRILEAFSFSPSSSSSSSSSSPASKSNTASPANPFVVGKKNGAASGFVGGAMGLFRSLMLSRCNNPNHCDLGRSAMVANPGAAGTGAGAFAAAVCAIGASFKTSSDCCADNPSVSFTSSPAFLSLPSTISSASSPSACSVGKVTKVRTSEESSSESESSESLETFLPTPRVLLVLLVPAPPCGAYMVEFAHRYTPRRPACVVASMSIWGERDIPVTGEEVEKTIVCNKRDAGTSHTRTLPSSAAAKTQRPSLENSRHRATLFSMEESPCALLPFFPFFLETPVIPFPPHRNVRTRRMPFTSSTRTVASAHAVAIKPDGPCPLAHTMADPQTMSPICFMSRNDHTRHTPSTSPQVTTTSLLPSVTIPATTPSCAGAVGFVFLANSVMPLSLSAMFQIDFAPPGRLSCRFRFSLYALSRDFSLAASSST
mmetsp:Transcript_12084/g.44916  ORF Transcript_12084/g.44916 Transcript_12084/m.44916 type:complete len:467 (+) Transcript_12084:1623-3023(+)